MNLQEKELLPDLRSDAGESSRYAQAHDLLTRGLHLLRFPYRLEGEYRISQALESAAAFRSTVFYVFLLYVILGAGILLLVPLETLDRWPLGYVSLGTVIAIAVVFSRFPALDLYYNAYVATLAFIGMAITIALPAIVDPPLIRQLAMIGIIHAAVVVGAILGLRFLHAVTAMWGGGLIGLILISTTGHSLDWPALHQTFTGGCLIGTFLAWLGERRTRQVFLQKTLLALEKERSDALAARMQEISRHDGLTGLANRRYFDEVLGREWLRCQRDGSSLSLIFIDIDFFKNYNDHYGHQAGDECLKRIGTVLLANARRPGDMASRYGGEEFVMLYPQTGPESARNMAERLLDAIRLLRLPHEKSRVSGTVTASIGVSSIVPEANYRPEQLIRAADHALYVAKREGRNRLCYADVQPG